MFKFVIKRIWYGFWVFLGVTTIVFFLFTVLPGDPARMMLGQRADIASVEAIQKELGLDRPVAVQYLKYLNDLSPISLHNNKAKESFFFLDPEKYSAIKLVSFGNISIVLKKPYLGRSYQTNRHVTSVLGQAFPNTLLLASVAIFIAMVFGVFIGVISMVKDSPLSGKFIMVFSVLGMALPSFFAAIIIAWLFAYALGDFTGLRMTGSLFSVDDFGRGEYLNLKNLVLPAITLGIRPLAVVIELTRSSLRGVMAQDFIRTARAKGLSTYRVITHHALRNAMNPVITSVSGWFASLMAGAVFVEFVFDWKGIGVVIVEALEYYDFPLVMGSVLLISFMLVIINIMVDILYGVLDPRVRLG